MIARAAAGLRRQQRSVPARSGLGVIEASLKLPPTSSSIFRCAVGSMGQAQIAGTARLRTGAASPNLCSCSAGSASPGRSPRCIDRIGKGIRGAPRDALVADYTTPEQRGAAMDFVPVAGYGGRVSRANDRDRPADVAGEQCARGFLDRGRLRRSSRSAILWFAVKEPSHLKPIEACRWICAPGTCPNRSGWLPSSRRSSRSLVSPEAFLILRGADIGLTITSDAVGPGGDESRLYVLGLSGRSAGGSDARAPHPDSGSGRAGAGQLDARRRHTMSRSCCWASRSGACTWG